MDIVSYVRGAQALRNVRVLDTAIVGLQAEGTFPSVDERLTYMEKLTANSLYQEDISIDLMTGDRTNLESGLPLTLIDEKQAGIFISEVIDLGAHHKERKTLDVHLTDAFTNEDGELTYENNSIKIEYQTSSNSTSWNGYYTASLDKGLTHKTDTHVSYRYMRIKITITPVKEELFDEENEPIGERYKYHKVKGIHINRTCLSPIGLLYRLDSAVLIENMRLDFKVAQLLNKEPNAYQTHIIFANSELITMDKTVSYQEDHGCLKGDGYIYFEELYAAIPARTIAVAIMGDVESIELYNNEWQVIQSDALTPLAMATKTIKLRIHIKPTQQFYGLAVSWLNTI